MATPGASATFRQFQTGYHPVPISETGGGSALRLCVVARDVSDPVAGMFVRLRDVMDAAVYLGCLVDFGGWVHEWVELWIQDINGLEGAPEAARAALTNAVLDERWKKRMAFLSRLDRSNSIEMPFEGTHPLPIYFDLAVSAPIHPVQAGAPWELCTDDRLLEQYNLPPYSGSLARYLSMRGVSGPPFLPMTAGAPQNESTQDPGETLGPVVPFNADGGLMMARKFAPLAFETYADLLGGQPWNGVEEGNKVFKFTGVYKAVQNGDARGHLFAKGGRGGRIAEAFHLKIDLLLQAFRLVRDFVRAEQLPFLNLSADSFRVSLSETSATLPFLWTAKVSLASTGAAIPLPEGKYFSVSGGASIYRLAAEGVSIRGSGSASIDSVSFEKDGTVELKGTLSTQESINYTDLLWLRFTFSPGRADFFASPSAEAAPGGCRFQTFPKKVSDALGVALRSAEGMRFPDIPFETLPSQGAWQDVRALGVLGVRVLLVNDEMRLGTALEKMEELSTAGGSELAKALGPHRLLHFGATTEEEALACIPPELWGDTIALLVQCVGEGRPGGPDPVESAFEPAISTLEELARRSRSLLFSDRRSSSEVSAVLQAALLRHSSAGES